jgi:hypothetical protein
MIYCVWYPSGGFGHFINAVLSLYGGNFARPKGALTFSQSGDSHSIDLTVPAYRFDQWPGAQFDSDINYSVLIDNGIDNSSEQFRTVFPDSQVIQVCYTDCSWPVVARAMIEKAMSSSINEQLPSWDVADWAVREKYFLFLRDHELRSAWRPNTNNFTVYVDNLFEYREFHNTLESCGIQLKEFEQAWDTWRLANSRYIDPVQTAQGVIDKITQQVYQDLTTMTDTWTQAVVYYFIWLKFGVEVPHNDYADFFKDTDEIQTWLRTA